MFFFLSEKNNLFVVCILPSLKLRLELCLAGQTKCLLWALPIQSFLYSQANDLILARALAREEKLAEANDLILACQT